MKARLLAVLLVSTLGLASITPVALAQDATAVDGKAAKGSNVQYVDCSQVAAALQNQYGAAVANDEATAEVANEQGITINQVNACLGNVSADGNNNGDDDDNENNEDENGDAAANNLEGGKDAVLAGTDPGGTLPNTGGPSLLVLGVALALVAGGTSLIGFSVRR